MRRQPKSSKTLHLTLWVAQVVLAGSFMWAGLAKLFQPVETIAAMWPWTGQVPVALVKLTGIADVAGAIGLILPSLLGNQAKLTPITALGVIVLMVCAGIFHIARGEASQIGVNVAFALIAAFIAWGRFKKVPITQPESKLS
jgi:uncharacterized membrane protein YphA (DoxX/SURF4 family)